MEEDIMAKSVVSISKGTDPEQMVEETLLLLGGVKTLIKANSTVVIKPNAGHPIPPETSANTSPAFVTAVIKVLRKANPKEIILAEASAIGCNTMESFEVTGIGKAAKEAGVDRIIDIKQEKDLIKIPIRDARSEITSVRLPKFLLEAEHIVNLPIFKSHASMVFTCALKNIKGVVQDKVHYQMHQTNLAEAMMDVWSVIKADLNIVDMIRPAEGFGPHSTTPVDFGCVVAGKDPVAVDATICRMIGLDIRKVPYFKPARERGLGNYDAKLIEIRGKPIKEVYKKLWLPYLHGFKAWPEYNLYLEGACSSCEGLLALTMERLKSMGKYEKNKGISIVVGRKKELPKGLKLGRDVILVGDCLKKYRGQGSPFSGGCPPAEPFPLWVIIDRKDHTEIGEGFRERMAEDEKYWKPYLSQLEKKRSSKYKK
jgi:uncharacterized protein (DUF362 family)